jgi:hypothetical protein
MGLWHTILFKVHAADNESQYRKESPKPFSVTLVSLVVGSLKPERKNASWYTMLATVSKNLAFFYVINNSSDIIINTTNNMNK